VKSVLSAVYFFFIRAIPVSAIPWGHPREASATGCVFRRDCCWASARRPV